MNYNDLKYNMFYLYPQSFYNCLVYGYLKNNTFFKTDDRTKPLYDNMKDRSSSKTKNDPTTKVAETLSAIYDNATFTENIITDYDTFFSVLTDKFMKDEIINKFNNLLITICGEDNNSGLREIEDIFSLTDIERNIATDSGINFISLYSDIFEDNLKTKINKFHKVFFEVNIKSSENGKYFFDNSFSYESTPEKHVDYSTRNYVLSTPDEFTYVGNGRTNGRGFRLPEIGKPTTSEHYRGHAVDSNINLCGNGRLSGSSKYSRVIKKLVVMNYLYSDDASNNPITPCRFELNGASEIDVPHIHLDDNNRNTPKNLTGIAFFRSGKEMFFVNSTKADISGELKSIARDIITNTIKHSSSSKIVFDYVDNIHGSSLPSEEFFEFDRIKLANGTYETAGRINLEDVVEGDKKVVGINSTDMSETTRKGIFNTVSNNGLNEYFMLNKEIGYSAYPKGGKAMKYNVEYLSYLISATVVEYFIGANDDVSGAYDRAIEKVYIDPLYPNFIVVEK